ncbi:MAG TPA: hypothetical protein VGG72_12235 [Bryobacteraceae bacterium]|jgi:hypothetical protein
MADLPELPQELQNAFEMTKAKAELDYATRAQRFPNHPQFASSGLHLPVLIHAVFFEFCAQVRNACKNGHWALPVARKAADAAWPAIFDFYFTRESAASSDERRQGYRAVLWQTVADDPRWKEHLMELATFGVGSKAAAVVGGNGAGENLNAASSAEAAAGLGGEMMSELPTTPPHDEGPGSEAPDAVQEDEQMDLKRRRTEKWIADMQAYHRRRLRGGIPETTRQEELLVDARHYALRRMTLAVNDLQLPSQASEADIDAACNEIRDRLVLRAWDDFCPQHKNHADCKLGFQEFEAALWTEGFTEPGAPSLEDRARTAIQERVAESKKSSSGSVIVSTGNTERSPSAKTRDLAVVTAAAALEQQHAKRGRKQLQKLRTAKKSMLAKAPQQPLTKGSASPQLEARGAGAKRSRKGDGTLLAGKDLVSFTTAEEYLGISERQRQSLMKDNILLTQGGGHNRKITTESLKAYLPPENPK